MNVIRKVLAGGAAAGLLAGASLVVGAPTQAAPIERVVNLQCSGDDSVLQGSMQGAPQPSQNILNLLGSLATPPQTPPVSLAIQAEVGIEVPAVLDPGQSGPVSFSSEILLPADLTTSLAGFGVTQVSIQNVTLGVAASNNAGAALSANPANFTLDLTTTPVVPPLLGPFQGTVTPELPGTPIVYSVGTVNFGVAVTTTVVGDVTIGMACTAADGVLGETSVTGTPPPTAPRARGAAGQPHFTG